MQAVSGLGCRLAAAVRGVGAGLGPSSLLAAARQGEAATQAIGQAPCRSIVSVDVRGNNVDAAWRTVTRRVMDNKMNVEWKRQAVYTKPTEMRKLAAEETEKRLRRRAFKAKLRWIFRRKAR